MMSIFNIIFIEAMILPTATIKRR